MITVGVDAHKRVHVAVALDERGRRIGEWGGANSKEGWAECERWLVELGDERLVGIEGSGSYGKGLAQHLVACGEAVYEVNSRLTAEGRRRSRRQGKSDALDAEAIARVVQREGERLPRVQREGVSEILALLVKEREALQAEATRTRNQLHVALLEDDPEYKARVGKLTSKAAIARLCDYESVRSDAMGAVLRGSIRRHAQRLGRLMEEIKQLTEEIQQRAAVHYAPLEEIRGVKSLTAGMLGGILGARHFESEAQLAAYAGVAPLEASSAGHVRHRLNRGGNRQLNAIVYRIAIAQLRHPGQARDYVSRKMTEGKTKREAIRALKRYITRAIWKQWQRCVSARNAPQTTEGCL